MISQNAFAMGDAPSKCPNRYDGPITSFIINNGSQTFDAMANPNVTFDENSQSRYTVTFVIHTQNSSSQGNSDPGTTWFSTSAPGYQAGHCVPASGIGNIGPNQNITISTNWGRAGTTSPYGGYQQVDAYTYIIPSDMVTFTVHWLSVPSPPSMQADAVSNSQINLSWTVPVHNGGSAIIGYYVERSTDNGTTWSTLVADTGNTTTYSDSGLTHSTTYAYRVSAINSVGTSQPSNTVTATTLNSIPSQPIDLKATAQLLQINLNWNKPSDNGGTPITGYFIERSTDDGNTWSTLVANTGSADTTYSDTNVFPLTTYTYRVSAINDVGTSDPSNTASATIPTVGPITPPSLP